jgi:GTP-binding protein EngB required for normal cell division
MVFGPSQHGKSTFINNLLKFAASTEEAKVGNGSGELVTIKVRTYDIGIIPEMFPKDRIGYDTFKLIDVPGTFDSGLRITKEEIFSEIKTVLMNNGIKELDCIIMFESMKDDSRKLNITMQTIIEVFGESVRKSILVLTTKWDTIDDDAEEVQNDYIESIILDLGVRHMKWQNNIKKKGKFLLSETEIKAQISKLGSMISMISSYYVSDMDLILKRKIELAERLMNEDPDRITLKDC